MDLKDSLQLLRKKNGYSQEELADKIGIARQTISKWENGQAVPELNGLLLLSSLYGVTIDRIVKENEECNLSLYPCAEDGISGMIDFLLFAKRNTYAAKDNQTKASRHTAHGGTNNSCRMTARAFCSLRKACFVGRRTS